MVKELYCFDCRRAANTECVEQNHRMNTEEVEGMGEERQPKMASVELAEHDIKWLIDCYEKDLTEADACGVMSSVKYDESRIACLRNVLSEQFAEKEI